MTLVSGGEWNEALRLVNCLRCFHMLQKTVKLIAFTVFCIYHKSCRGCIINIQCVYLEHQKSSP